MLSINSRKCDCPKCRRHGHLEPPQSVIATHILSMLSSHYSSGAKVCVCVKHRTRAKKGGPKLPCGKSPPGARAADATTFVSANTPPIVNVCVAIMHSLFSVHPLSCTMRTRAVLPFGWLYVASMIQVAKSVNHYNDLHKYLFTDNYNKHTGPFSTTDDRVDVSFSIALHSLNTLVRFSAIYIHVKVTLLINICF